jgi:hypothetical protein
LDRIEVSEQEVVFWPLEVAVVGLAFCSSAVGFTCWRAAEAELP